MIVAAGIPAEQVEITVHKKDGEVRFGFKQKETHAQAPDKAVGKAQRVTAAKVAAAPREQRNGVKRPRPGGACAAVWQWLDQHPGAKLADVRETTGKKGWNQNNAAIEFYGWRKFNAVAKAA